MPLISVGQRKSFRRKEGVFIHFEDSTGVIGDRRVAREGEGVGVVAPNHCECRIYCVKDYHTLTVAIEVIQQLKINYDETSADLIQDVFLFLSSSISVKTVSMKSEYSLPCSLRC